MKNCPLPHFLFFFTCLYGWPNYAETYFSEDFDRLLERAKEHTNDAQHEDAVEIYTRLLDQTDNLEMKQSIQFQLAYSYAQSGADERALKLLHDSRFNEQIEPLLLEIDLLKKQCRFEEARDKLEAYLSQFPNPANAWVQWEFGWVTALNGDFHQSRTIFEEMTTTHPSRELLQWITIGLAESYLGLNQLDKATAAVNQISDDPSTQWYKNALEGRIAAAQDRPEQARKFLLASGNSAPKEMQGRLFFQLSLSSSLSEEEKKRFLNSSEQLFRNAFNENRSRECALELAKCLLCKGSLKEAEEILLDPSLFGSYNTRMKALSCLAEWTPILGSYDPVELLTQNALIEDQGMATHLRFYRGLKFLHAGSQANDPVERKTLLNRAVDQFAARASYEKQNNLHTLQETYRHLALCHHLLDSTQPIEVKDIRNLFIPTDETLFLEAFIASQKESQSREKAEQLLTTFIASYPDSHWTPKAYLLLGGLLQQKSRKEKAHECYHQLIQNYPTASCLDEALLFAAYTSDSSESHSYLKRLCNEYPHSPLAPEAYFYFYSFRDYLQGEKESLLHLEELPKKYPHSVFSAIAYYLIGLDYERTRLNHSGKTLRRRDLVKAIDAFQSAIETYEEHPHKDQRRFYVETQLEKARCHLSISSESVESKRDIHLAYAIEQLDHLIASISEDANLFPQYLEQAVFLRVQSLAQMDQTDAALTAIDESLAAYQKKSITRGYFLSKLYGEKGSLLMKKERFREAVRFFTQAEESGGGKVLSDDERLEFAIQKANCHLSLGDATKAMKILSRVINEDVISSKRLKAMYCRAEVYESQSRNELAFKQLVALSKKGGEWANAAKEKLVKVYGY